MTNDTATQIRWMLQRELTDCRQLVDNLLGTAQSTLPHAIRADSPITLLMEQLLTRPDVQGALRSDALNERVLRDTIEHFLHTYEEKASFRIRTRLPEFERSHEAWRWSNYKIAADWPDLLRYIEERHATQGFAADFYRREFNRLTAVNSPETSVEVCALTVLWHHLLRDWERTTRQTIETEMVDYVRTQSTIVTRLLSNNLTHAVPFARRRDDSEELFRQTWALMGGRWNEVEYERMRRVARLQLRYPVINGIARLMGRHAADDGRQRLSTSAGGDAELHHAAKSDIVGISTGNDLNALLPQEMALYADESTEDVFFERFVTRRLQTFLYESHSHHPDRSLHARRAAQRGPMVVCVDTSGSMKGAALQIAMSVCMKLSELCHQQHRPCYLIGFAVQARPIDVMNDRTALLRFFQSPAQGNTDARHMLDSTFRVLTSTPLYQGADVLWVTDFRIPMPEKRYLLEMERLQTAGTRWYGLQIGIAENSWVERFDAMFKIEDVLR